MRPNWIAIGCFSAALAVMLGAYGSHGLQGKVSQGDYEVWKTAVLYESIHAVALVLFGLYRERRAAGEGPGWAFLLGTVLFCAPLYGHPFDAPGWTLHLAPVGGLALMLGWILFAVSALRSGRGGAS
jgi:uncharacterized membrane protein YgdD (TMEM256/DUF423 family)